MVEERTGTWVLYNGKEYQLSISPLQLSVISSNASDEKLGFRKDPATGLYKKEILPAEIKAACTYVPYAKYRGTHFSVMVRNGDDELLLVSDEINPGFAKEHGFSEGERNGYFEKWVKRSELDDYFTVKGTFRKYKLL